MKASDFLLRRQPASIHPLATDCKHILHYTECWLNFAGQCYDTQYLQIIKCTATIPLHPFNGLFSGQPGQAGSRKAEPFWILLKQEMMGCSGISWTTCKSFALRSRQITTLHNNNSTHLMTICPGLPEWASIRKVKHLITQIFYRLDAFPDAQPTLSKHWRHWHYKKTKKRSMAQLL